MDLLHRGDDQVRDPRQNLCLVAVSVFVVVVVAVGARREIL